MSAATDLARAILDGEKAARAGKPLKACPHNPKAPTARERVLATMWLRGHARISPPPVDYSG